MIDSEKIFSGTNLKGIKCERIKRKSIIIKTFQMNNFLFCSWMYVLEGKIFAEVKSKPAFAFFTLQYFWNISCCAFAFYNFSPLFMNRRPLCGPAIFLYGPAGQVKINGRRKGEKSEWKNEKNWNEKKEKSRWTSTILF